MRKRILHIITGLSTGGAERSLVNLISGPLADRFHAHVVSLDDEGDFGGALADAGVGVDSLHFRRRRSPIRAALDLRKVMRSYQPDLVQGWMYHGNLAASLATRFANMPVPVLWNIRQSLYDVRTEKRGTQGVIRLLARTSVRPAAIIYNSHQSRLHHEAFGFASSHGVVIPNGFDPARWHPDPGRRSALRALLGLRDEDILLGFVGRHHPQKDVPTFLKACAEAMRTNPRLHVMLVGEGLTADNPALSANCALIPARRIHLLGRRGDVETILPGCDIFCLSSSSEAFPNVLGEGMASALPCIATDVGDCALLLGGHGRIVPPGKPAAMAAAIAEIAGTSLARRTEIGEAARTRIVDNFGLDKTIEAYVELYDSILKREN